MASGIYIISNTRNGMVYVGSSTDIDRRWEQHRRELDSGRHPNRQLQRDWRHYGDTSFNFTVVERVEELSRLSENEQNWINHYRSTVGLPFLYNLELNVPARIEPDPTAVIPSSKHKQSPHDRIHRQGLILGIVLGFIAMLPVSMAVSRMLASAPDWMTAPFGVVYVLTWVGAGYAIRNWYIYHSLNEKQIQCPVCSATYSALDSFCPQCGQPRTHLRLKIEQAARNSPRSYEQLLERERRKQSQPPAAVRAFNRLPESLRNPVGLTLDSGTARLRLYRGGTWLQARPGMLYLACYLAWLSFIWLVTVLCWSLLNTGVVD